MSKFDELKKLAESAPPGPWEVGGSNGRMIYDAQGYLCGDSDLLVTAKFKAAANPAAILELLAILAQLVAALKAAKTWHNGEKWRDSSDPSEVRAWEQHRDIIADALAAAGAQP